MFRSIAKRTLIARRVARSFYENLSDKRVGPDEREDVTGPAKGQGVEDGTESK